MRRITEEEFRLIKSKLRWLSPFTVAQQVGRHKAIVSKIAVCRNYHQYKMIVKAEHPPIKNSLTERVKELEKRVASLEEARERLQTELAFELHRSGDGREVIPRN